ncbi:MAG: NUDIX domain-containing protein [Proteobacteria bacterium]|nr:NUDIX domain-containing protein [Pseudomonadota bacterium]
MTAIKARAVEIIEKEEAYRGYFRIDRYRLKHRQFDGAMGAEIDREIFERGHAAACLLYDPDLHKLVLIEQFRAGALAALASPWFDEDETSPWLIEIIAGIIEDGEDPEAVVRREALEEAGCAIGEIEPLFHYLVSPGGSSESMFVFCGRVDASNAGGIHGLRHEGEDIRVLVADAQEVFAMLDEGRIINGMTLIPLQWFRAHHQELRRRWLGGG